MTSPTAASEVALLTVPLHRDSRGAFSKPFSAAKGGDFAVAELFWSVSAKGAVRGMHFQTPPVDLAKLVWVSFGAIVDVVVDLRQGEGFGTVHAFELDAETGTAVWVPSGFAHGFQALTDGAIVNYATDAQYSREHDQGVRWDSVGFDWPLPVTAVSDRDAGFVALSDYDSPFTR